MKKISILINPHAKKIRRGRISIDDIRGLESDNFSVYITGSLEDLESAVSDIKASGSDYIAILGGDGTLHKAITQIILTYEKDPVPPILILNGGTMNNVARSFGLKGKSVSILRRMLAVISRNIDPVIVERDTMCIDGRYCFLFGTGFVTNFLNAAYSGEEKGFRQNLSVMIKSVYQGITGKSEGGLFEGITADVTADGVLMPYRNIRAVLAGTVEHIGMGFTPLSRAVEKAGCFHALIPGYTPDIFIKNIFSIKAGRKINHPLNFDAPASRLSISAEKPFQYTMDGDLYWSQGRLDVVMGKRVSFIKV